jgi:adenine-specific DNA-methyltransferase
MTKVIERCLLMTTDPGDLVLDPTCGSGTTAFVAEEWGRRWITVDTSRVALALARTRLMSAKLPYYLLADSPEGVKKETEITGRTPPAYTTSGDIRKGFVYKRVPHITLGSIANNPDIKKGMPPKEINEAIARHADIETLYDQPYEDNKRVRVTGPFTVESLSPHRFMALDDEHPAAEKNAQQGSDAIPFETMILENLKKSGVQNTIKNERIKFEQLNSYAGQNIQATGEYIDKDGKTKRVAVSIGPQYGTVGPEQVKEAAKEAVQGIGFDVLIVCGFAFDPHVSEEARRYGNLTVLITRMTPELYMGDELLKITGAGNLFMVFGEPDVIINKQKDGKFTVEIKGLDIYDPTTGQVRSNSTDDIACWFIDTDYNGESFFVRHAYFTDGADRFERLKRTLRAEIDESAWESLYATTSRPFAPPKTGKIAVKVINHYGDEVLKVYEVK